MAETKYRNVFITDWHNDLFNIWNDKFQYAYVGKHVGEKSKREHWHAYIELKSQHRLKALKKLINAQCDIEVVRGTRQQAEQYINKENTGRVIGGEPKAPGKRNDIEKAKEIIRTTGKMRDVIDNVSSYQAIKTAELIMKHVDYKRRDWVPEVYWFYGKTGTGKTKTAFDMTNSETRWVSSKSLKWWDGYDGHEDVVIDDFRADFCTFHELLRILDRYEYRVEYKGGSRQLLAKRIFITTPKHPDETYDRTDEEKAQLTRRITEIREFN